MAPAELERFEWNEATSILVMLGTSMAPPSRSAAISFVPAAQGLIPRIGAHFNLPLTLVQGQGEVPRPFDTRQRRNPRCSAEKPLMFRRGVARVVLEINCIAALW